MNLITQADYARLTGVTPQTISRKTKKGHLPSEGGMVDLDNDEIKLYLAHKTGSPIPKKEVKTYDEPQRLPGLREGQRQRMSDAIDKSAELKLRKLEAQTQHLEIKNAKELGTLVSREAVARGVINPIDTFFVRLLADGSKALAETLTPMVKGGATVAEVEESARAILSKFIKPLKSQMVKAIKEQENGFES